MEPPQSPFRIHPEFLVKTLALFQDENIPYQLEYKRLEADVGYFELNSGRQLNNENNKLVLDFLVTCSEAYLKKEIAYHKRIAEIDRDFDRIKADLRCLIFHVSLERETPKEKKKTLRELLQSDTARKLR